MNNAKLIITNGVNARKNIKTMNISIFTPPLLLIIIKQKTRVLIFVYFSHKHVVIIIYLQK